MSQTSTYTIAEAAALTGLHRNTIRMRIKLGQLEATVRPGKFGDEYRISHSALVSAGLLAVEGPLGDANVGAAVLFVLWVFYTAIVFLLGAVVAETWELRAMQQRQRATLG